MTEFEQLEGKTLIEINVEKTKDSVTFATACGKRYRLAHIQDCCEHVWLEDIVGDINDLIGTPIVVADELIFKVLDPELRGYGDSKTGTFYSLRTAKGDVTLRFYGESNGYYSESVDFIDVTHEEDNN